MPFVHDIPPVYDESSRVLVLGSFPSVRSRETGFFYGHKQNRFWQVLAAVLARELPVTIADKREMLISSHIALWDVVKSCDIEGSSDNSIREAVPNDLCVILNSADIRQIYINGGAAHALYNKLCRERTGMDAIRLPSTSPANARCSLGELISAWRAITQYL